MRAEMKVDIENLHKGQIVEVIQSASNRDWLTVIGAGFLVTIRKSECEIRGNEEGIGITPNFLEEEDRCRNCTLFTPIANSTQYRYTAKGKCKRTGKIVRGEERCCSIIRRDKEEV